ncbi:MAG: hypothetical protein MHPSP_000403, partial [Paramarteilia canceri]
ITLISNKFINLEARSREYKAITARMELDLTKTPRKRKQSSSANRSPSSTRNVKISEVVEDSTEQNSTMVKKIKKHMRNFSGDFDRIFVIYD